MKRVTAGPTLTYFAYGSNMSTQRLRDRVPGCEPLGTAILPGHTVRFHKVSKDGSAKCDAYRTDVEGECTHGVLFEIPVSQKPALDRAEGAGKGYDICTVTVQLPDSQTIEAMTYIASPSHIDASLSPLAEYVDFVLSGAREHGLPEAYVQMLSERAKK